MAESFTRTGFAVVCTSCGSDANAVRLTGKEFEVYLNFAPLTGRSAKWYIDCIQTQLNLENLIFQASQTPAAGKNLKPYQGLKQHCPGPVRGGNFAGKNLKPYQGLKPNLLRMDRSVSRRKKPKTLSGIETKLRIALTTIWLRPEKT